MAARHGPRWRLPLPRDLAPENRIVPHKTTPLAERDFRRILIVKLSAVGDVIHTIPLLNALRRRYPDARIDWLLKPSLAELVQHHPNVSTTYVYGENHTEAPRYNWDGFTHWLQLMRDARFLGLLRELRRNRYDLVVDVHSQLRTGFINLVTGAPVRIGFGRPQREVWEPAGRKLPPGTIKRSWKGARDQSWIAYTHHIPLPSLDVHAVDRYLSVAGMLGAPPAAADFSFPIPEAADRQIDRLLAAAGIDPSRAPVLLAPAALWETKRWRPEGFAAVARHFLAAGRPVVLVGSPAERAECEAVVANAPGAADLAGQTTLVELTALIRRAAICLTNDSGPMHIAVALDRPVIAVFGPTNPAWIGPYGRPDAVVRAGLPCSPCNLRKFERCPHDHACMRQLAPEPIIARMEALLAAPLATRAGGTSAAAGPRA